MKPTRREFLILSAVGGAVTALVPAACAFTLPDPPKKARLRLSCQEGVAPGKTLAEKLDFLEEHGVIRHNTLRLSQLLLEEFRHS